jgi:transposase
MRDWYRELAHLYVYTALRKGEIAKKLNRNASTITRALQNPDFIRTIPLLVYDEKRPEDVDTDQEDHIYDEARYGIMYRAGRPERIRSTRPSIRPREREYDGLSF